MNQPPPDVVTLHPDDEHPVVGGPAPTTFPLATGAAGAAIRAPLDARRRSRARIDRAAARRSARVSVSGAPGSTLTDSDLAGSTTAASSAAAGNPVPPRWLSADERLTWLSLNALLTVLPASVETQLGRAADLTFFEFTVLAALSERPDRTLRMSELAMLANGSLSRLSHVARRLESRGYLHRRPLPEDGRITVAVLDDAGHEAVRAAAPAHVAHVRTIVFDRLSAAEQAEFGRLALKLVDGIDPTMGSITRSLGRRAT